MGKKKKDQSNLGRSLVKDRFGANAGKKIAGNSLLHTSEINDGYDWGRLNLQSVTEESSFQEFLSTAELAGTEFQAEKLKISFVTPTTGLLTHAERTKKEQEHEEHKSFLRIPRRPKWDVSTSAEQLQEQERKSFLEWRHELAVLQEEKELILTPYEKNLEFWRQLWRVVERSDLLVQIVDARNPLMFRCEDLENYVKEIDEKKINLLLLNKSDLLTEEQRQVWTDYFNTEKIRIAFFSALEPETLEESPADENEINNEAKNCTEIIKACSETEQTGLNSPKLLSRVELIHLFKSFTFGRSCTCVGLVGYPNVGKSSTINALLQEKKVSVSHTPGKTKHFQTLFLEPELLLCDCPGLVMPSFVCTKADMVVNGILPVDQLKDHNPSVSLISSLIPRHVFEDRYGLMLPKPHESEDPNRPPTADELLSAYGYNRGFMTQRGLPDVSRSARCILKDFVNGKLLFCYAPPGYDQHLFHTFPVKKREASFKQPPQMRRIPDQKMTSESLDKIFFSKASIGHHVKGNTMPGVSPSPVSNESSSSSSIDGKPWKRHNNKNKREKLRRVYAHLDN